MGSRYLFICLYVSLEKYFELRRLPRDRSGSCLQGQRSRARGGTGGPAAMIPQKASVQEAATCEFQRLYDLRFRESQEYRRRLWKILTRDFFQPLIPSSSHVLDLGCGWGEFINQIDAALKYAMDLNPESRQRLAPNIHFIEQDCSAKWPLGDRSLDVVFSSNFFEHLRAKDLDLDRPWARSVAVSSLVADSYAWDRTLNTCPEGIGISGTITFPLTEQSLREVLEVTGFEVERCISKFVPYQMVRRKPVPLLLVRLYLKLPWTWHFFGQQFLVIASSLSPNSHRPGSCQRSVEVRSQKSEVGGRRSEEVRSQ